MALKWSKEEDEVLKELYPRFLEGFISMEDILKVLPLRSEMAVFHRAKRLKLTGRNYGRVDYDALKKLKKRIEL